MGKNVFISWSGEMSHRFALALYNWLPTVIQAIDPFISSEDIRKGTRWFQEVQGGLQEISFGILCLTPDNIHSDWILFEAGALSKLGHSRLSPILINVSNSDLYGGPLSHFNTTSINRGEFYKLLKSINESLRDGRLSDNRLETAFALAWPNFEKQLGELIPEPQNQEEDEDEAEWLSLEVSDRNILSAVYKYTMRTNKEYVQIDEFLQSEESRELPSESLREDLAVLFEDNYLENSYGRDEAAIRVRLSPIGFRLCGVNLEEDFLDAMVKGAEAIIDRGVEITSEEIVERTEKPYAWVILLIRNFASQGWIHFEFEFKTSILKVTWVSPKFKRIMKRISITE